MTRAAAAEMRATDPAEMRATAAGMTPAATASMATTTAATPTAAAAFSRVCRSRQRGHKNNNGNPEFEFQHNLFRSVRRFRSTHNPPRRMSTVCGLKHRKEKRSIWGSMPLNQLR
jgi:hypothetical protein